jgi:hypothetical protein
MESFESTTVVDDLYCPACGYNLRGLPEYRCPECGGEFDVGELVVSQIPWAHRRVLGRFRAYWKTVLMVMFNNRRFCQETAGPVSYGDSQSFRWVTVLHIYFPLAVLTFAYYVLGERSLYVVLGDVWQTVGLHITLLLTAGVATGFPSYFFHPRSIPVERQNRAVALSYYACGPMAWTPLLFVIVCIVSNVFDDTRVISMGILIYWIAEISLLAIWLIIICLTFRRTVALESGGKLLVCMVMPVLWILSIGVTHFGVDAVVRMLGLMYYSLQG